MQMNDVYGIDLKQFFVPSDFRMLVSLVAKGGGLKDLSGGYLGSTLYKYGPEWLLSLIDREDLEVYLSRDPVKIIMGVTSEKELLEKVFPTPFLMTAQWELCDEKRKARG